MTFQRYAEIIKQPNILCNIVSLLLKYTHVTQLPECSLPPRLQKKTRLMNWTNAEIKIVIKHVGKYH